MKLLRKKSMTHGEYETRNSPLQQCIDDKLCHVLNSKNERRWCCDVLINFGSGTMAFAT
jgi:hypothetical protein